MFCSYLFFLQISNALSKVADDFKLEFRDSKCYVTFGPNCREKPKDDALISMRDDKNFPQFSFINSSVYLALKYWRGPGNKLEIRTFKHEPPFAEVPNKKIKLDPEVSDILGNLLCLSVGN